MKRKTRKNIKSFSLPCILFAGIFSFDVALNAQVSLQKQLSLPNHKEQVYAVNAIPPEYLNCDDTCIYGFVEGITVDKIRREGYTTLQIPDYIEKIADNAFFNMFDGLSTHVETLLLGKELKVIGDNAFRGCSGFNNTIDFSTTQIEQIGTSAFENCTNISAINFVHDDPKEYETLQSIGERCFASCECLTEIVLPDSLQNIQNYAFDNCNCAGKIDLSKYEIIPQWVINNIKVFRNCGKKAPEDEKNIFVNLKGAPLSQWDELLKNHRETGSQLVVAPSSVTTTTADAYEVVKDQTWTWGEQDHKYDTYKIRNDFDTSNIYTIYVPKEAKAIDIDLENKTIKHPLNIEFEENSQLEAFKISNVEYSRLFYGEIKFPNSLQYIGKSSFYRSNITKVTLPNNGKMYIDEDAFHMSTLVELVIPPLAFENTSFCGRGAFLECENLSFIDCQMPTDKSEFPWTSGTIFQEVGSTGTIIIPKEIGCPAQEDQERLRKIENQLCSLHFPNNIFFDAYTQDPKPENKWFVSSYENTAFPNDSFMMNKKDEIYKLNESFDDRKSEYNVLQLPDNTKTIKSDVFKECFGSVDSDDKKTWIFRPNVGLSTIQSGALANNSNTSPSSQNGLIVNSVLPNTISKMDDPFGTNYNIRGAFVVPKSTIELTNFSIEHTNITRLVLSPSLKIITAKMEDKSSTPFKSPYLTGIDLTSFRTWEDFEKVKWDPHIFDLEHFDKYSNDHFIYISPPPEGVNPTEWQIQIESWINYLRDSIYLDGRLKDIGWYIMRSL